MTQKGNDMLFGYCHWIKRELISDDGDTYSVEEDVIKYEFYEVINYEYIQRNMERNTRCFKET